MDIKDFFTVMEKIRSELEGDYAPTQLSVLLMCYIRPGVTHPELSQLLNLPQATISRAVARLSKAVKKHPDRTYTGRGLVENRADEVHDSRRKAVFLTKDGERLVKYIETLIRQ